MQDFTNDFNEELDEDLNINVKKIFKAINSHIIALIIIYVCSIAFFIVKTYTDTKIYTVSASLYINKANTTNLAEINPYVLGETFSAGGLAALSGGSANLQNEIELIKTNFILDKVIKENNLRYGKLYGLFATKKTGEYYKSDVFAKMIKIDLLKNTQIVTIKYSSPSPELSYNVVNSLIKTYQKAFRDINIKKSEKDVKLLTEAYESAKKELETNFNKSTMYPETAMTGPNGLMAMSAFSKSAASAFGNIVGGYKTTQKNEIKLETAKLKLEKITEKLEYAKLIQKMSLNATKVVIVSAPQMPKDYEYVSPKLTKNIITGIIFGLILGILFLIIVERKSKKLTYSQLDDEIIYKDNNTIDNLSALLLANRNNKVIYIAFSDVKELLQEATQKKRITIFDGNTINDKLFDSIDEAEKIILFASIGKTNSIKYINVKNYIVKTKKEILAEVLV